MDRGTLWAGVLSVWSLLALLLGGCASSDLDPYRRELEARHVVAVDVGPELTLTSAPFERLVSTIDSAGTAHVVGVLANLQIHHITIGLAGTLHDEVVGTMPPNSNIRRGALDIVEHPVGTIRIAAGDTEYWRAQSSGDWAHAAGNRCRQYLVRTASLYCAFVASGEDVGTAARTDVNVVLIFIVPIVWPNVVRPGKLVLAELVDESWVVRTAVDPGTNWSADEADFAAGVDQRDMAHLIFHAWRGGSQFLMGPSGGGVAGGPSSELRYARFPLPVDGVRGRDRRDWQEAQSEKIAPNPRDRWGLLGHIHDIVGFLPGAGTAINLMSLGDPLCAAPSNWRINPIPWGTAFLGDASFELLGIDGCPTLLRIGADDSRHVLLATCQGSWTTVCQMAYVRRSGDGMLAKAMLGGAAAGLPTTLAVGSQGTAFAAWVGRSGKSLVGQWINARPAPIEVPTD